MIESMSKLLVIVLLAMLINGNALAQTETPTPTPTNTPAPTPTQDPNTFYTGYYEFESGDSRISNTGCVSNSVLYKSYLYCAVATPNDEIVFTMYGDSLVIYTYYASGTTRYNVCIDATCSTFFSGTSGGTIQLSVITATFVMSAVDFYTVTITPHTSFTSFDAFMVLNSVDQVGSGGDPGDPGDTIIVAVDPPLDPAYQYDDYDGHIVRYGFTHDAGQFMTNILLFVLLCIQTLMLILISRQVGQNG